MERERTTVEARLVRFGRVRRDGAQPGDERTLQLALLRKGRRFGVQGRQSVLAGVIAPARIMVDLVGRELELDDPARLGVLPARPAFPDDAEGGETVADDGAECRTFAKRIDVGRRVDRYAQSGRDDVLAFGDDRAFEALDVLQGSSGDGGNVLCGHAGTDVRLHFARREFRCVRGRFGLALAKPGLQYFVDGDAEPFTVVARGEQCTVLDSDDL